MANDDITPNVNDVSVESATVDESKEVIIDFTAENSKYPQDIASNKIVAEAVGTIANVLSSLAKAKKALSDIGVTIDSESFLGELEKVKTQFADQVNTYHKAVIGQASLSHDMAVFNALPSVKVKKMFRTIRNSFGERWYGLSDVPKVASERTLHPFSVMEAVNVTYRYANGDDGKIASIVQISSAAGSSIMGVTVFRMNYGLMERFTIDHNGVVKHMQFAQLKVGAQKGHYAPVVDRVAERHLNDILDYIR